MIRDMFTPLHPFFERLDEFDRPQESHVVGANSKPKASVGIHRLTKMVVRDAIKRLREEKAEWLKSCSTLQLLSHMVSPAFLPFAIA